MEDVPTPRELRGAARATTILAYAAGLAGVAAGTLLLREGEVALAILLYIVTFAVGAVLMGVALLARAMAGLSARIMRVESDVRVLLGDRARHGAADDGIDRDPWVRHPPRG